MSVYLTQINNRPYTWSRFIEKKIVELKLPEFDKGKWDTDVVLCFDGNCVVGVIAISNEGHDKTTEGKVTLHGNHTYKCVNGAVSAELSKLEPVGGITGSIKLDFMAPDIAQLLANVMELKLRGTPSTKMPFYFE
jgi:hypothetical protein